jgi:NitT/TauT family transport system substrate-binding protein
MFGSESRSLTRRGVLAATGASLGTVAGCIGGDAGAGEGTAETAGSAVTGTGTAGTTTPRPTESVSVILNWKPNPTQAGYFVARDRGFYEDVGLDVELVSGQGGGFAAKQVGLGNYDIGLGGGVAVLQARATDLSVRSVAAVQQSSNAALFTVAEQYDGPFEQPADLAGTRIAVVSGSSKTKTYIQSMLRQEGILDSVELVSVGTEQQTSNLLAGNVDVATGIFSNALALRMQGYDASLMLIGDHTPTVGRTAFTRPSVTQNDRDVLQSFLRGTARGWAWASNNPEAAADVMIEAQPSLGESRELGVAKIKYTAKNLILTEAVRQNGWGWQSATTWTGVHDTLSAAGVLPGGISPGRAWTNGLLPDDPVVTNYADRVSIDYTVDV